MPKPTPSEFQVTVKNFKSLFVPNGLKKATIEDLGLLRDALVLGTEELNKLIGTLSTLPVNDNKQKSIYKPNTNNVNFNTANNVVPNPQVQELGLVNAVTGLDTTAVSLFDAEEEARRSNEAYMNSLPNGEVPIDEVEVLEEMFASIEEGV